MTDRKPWTYGSNVKDRVYLEDAQSFDDLAEELCDALERTTLSAVRFRREPAQIDPKLVAAKCSRGSWHIELNGRVLDKFFNGKMGIRAQYYVSPQHGQFMNRLLLSKIGERLVAFAVAIEPTVDTSILRLSLTAESAKVWICEKTLQGQRIIGCPTPSLVEDEIHNDWLDVARKVQRGEDGPTHRPALHGVRAPLADQLEIKGAWITESDRVECVPLDKRDRDLQLYNFGFT